MAENEIRETGRKIIAEYLNVDLIDCADNARLIADLKLDSLDAVEILMEVETRFDIAVEEGEADRVGTVGDFLDSLVRKVLYA